MNKFLTILVVLFTSAGLLQAQQYVRVKKDFTSDSIKFFKGELYIYDTLKKSFTVNGKKFNYTDDVELHTNAEQLQETDKFVEKIIKKQNETFIHINISSVKKNAGDTVWLANTAQKIIPIVTKTAVTVRPDSLESTFRLIIPGAVTVWYSKDNLDKSGSYPWWVYLLAFLLFAMLFIIVVRKINRKKKKRKKNKPFCTVVFNSSIMSEFTDKYGGMDKLHELNPKLIPSTKKWNTMENSEKKGIIIRLQGKSIKIPDENPDSGNVDTQPPVYNGAYRQTNEINSLTIEKVQLEEQLKFKNSEIERLRLEKENLTAEKTDMEYRLKAKDEEINLLQQERLKWNSEYVPRLDYTELETRYNLLSEKIISVDFLRNYAEVISAYFNLCSEVERKADSYYERIVLRYDYHAALIACLLQKFRSSVCELPVSYWRQIVTDIKETGITADRHVIRIFSQPPVESEKQREFRRMLFREVIIRYSSSVLILAESFRKLARFGIDAVYSDEAELDFRKYIAEIVGKAKTIDMEIKYVPLFEKFDGYSAKIESVNKKMSFPYSEIRDLESDSIAEIVSYGVKTEFEDIKTQIIIE